MKNYEIGIKPGSRGKIENFIFLEKSEVKNNFRIGEIYDDAT